MVFLRRSSILGRLCVDTQSTWTVTSRVGEPVMSAAFSGPLWKNRSSRLPVTPRNPIHQRAMIARSDVPPWDESTSFHTCAIGEPLLSISTLTSPEPVHTPPPNSDAALTDHASYQLALVENDPPWEMHCAKTCARRKLIRHQSTEKRLFRREPTAWDGGSTPRDKSLAITGLLPPGVATSCSAPRARVPARLNLASGIMACSSPEPPSLRYFTPSETLYNGP